MVHMYNKNRLIIHKYSEKYKIASYKKYNVRPSR